MPKYLLAILQTCFLLVITVLVVSVHSLAFVLFCFSLNVVDDLFQLLSFPGRAVAVVVVCCEGNLMHQEPKKKKKKAELEAWGERRELNYN